MAIAKTTEPYLQVEIKHLKSVTHLMAKHMLNLTRWAGTILIGTFCFPFHFFCFNSTLQNNLLKVDAMKCIEQIF